MYTHQREEYPVGNTTVPAVSLHPMRVAEQRPDQIIYREVGDTGTTVTVAAPQPSIRHDEVVTEDGRRVQHTETRSTMTPTISAPVSVGNSTVHEEQLQPVVSTRAYETFRRDPMSVFPDAKILSVGQMGPVVTPSGCILDPRTNTIYNGAFNPNDYIRGQSGGSGGHGQHTGSHTYYQPTTTHHVSSQTYTTQMPSQTYTTQMPTTQVYTTQMPTQTYVTQMPPVVHYEAGQQGQPPPQYSGHQGQPPRQYFGHQGQPPRQYSGHQAQPPRKYSGNQGQPPRQCSGKDEYAPVSAHQQYATGQPQHPQYQQPQQYYQAPMEGGDMRQQGPLYYPPPAQEGTHSAEPESALPPDSY